MWQELSQNHGNSHSDSSSLAPMSEPLEAHVKGPVKSPHQTKRSEVLRHMLPHPSRGRTIQRRKSTVRISKPMQKNAFLHGLPSRPRAFHKYLSAFFTDGQDHSVHTNFPQPRSSVASLDSKLELSVYESVPSIDVVSPATFTFSGPSLRSGRSFSHSTSVLPSFGEIDGEPRLLRRTQTDSFCMLDQKGSIEEEMNANVMEPDLEHGIIRTMSDVLLGNSAPVDKLRKHSMIQPASMTGCSGNLVSTRQLWVYNY